MTLTNSALRGTEIQGIGVYRPRRVVSNEEICERVDSSDEWIRSRTGIVTRRWASEDETLEFMATRAATAALATANCQPEAVDMVLVATCTNAQSLWTLAARVASALGTEAPALEVNATCAGFCYALGLGRDLVRAGSAERVLIVGVERMTDILDYSDRGTAFIFADGAGAVVVGPSEREGIGPVAWGSDGGRGDSLVLSPDWQQFRDDPSQGNPVLSMQGRRIFKWAAERMPLLAEAACKSAGYSLEDIDAFIPHQANQRITEAIATALKLGDTVTIADDITMMGNTSSASIPLAAHQLLTDGRAQPGDLALLIGFGGGLSYAAQVITLPSL
jgi:3-oxoacyl-(acyl-carrier-protein) synthase III